MSAGAKQMALDRLSDADKNPNSVFTRFFVQELVKPNQTLVQTAKRTQVAVRGLAKTVGFEQTPAYYDQIIGDVILVRTDPPAEVAGGIAPPQGSFSKTSPSVAIQGQLQLTPSVSVGQGVTLGPGVIIGGKQAELLVAEQTKQQNGSAKANPALGVAPEAVNQQVALISPNPDVPGALQNNPAQVQPPIASFLRSNSGWTASISLPEPAIAISYRIGRDGAFDDLGLMDFLDQRTGRRMPNINITMSPSQAATVIEVKYQRASGEEMGPFPIRFEPENALFDMQKKTLDQLWPSWAAFRDFDAQRLLYFTTLISYRCAISEVRYGLDNAQPLKRFDLPPCDTKDPYSIPENAKIWTNVPVKTSGINIQLYWRDGTKSPVHRIEP
jgi:hypothetical protein